jgi:predicted Holliday junction resolvase-like endonuclease
LNFLLEITLIGCIIYLTILFLKLKEKQSNADSLEKQNTDLKKQLTQNYSQFQERESYFKQTIDRLQSSFNKEQELIKERKLELDLKEQKLLKELNDLEERLTTETENRKKVTSQKKSSEVRLGHIAETLAPFLDQFDFDPENCTFLGKPIDYISFGDDEITFIEVKSGNSQLNKKQRHIRDLVKAKFVSWKEVRIK